MFTLNSNTAELIGIHVGDGTLYKTNWSIVWELRGSLNEKDYYLNNVVPLLYKIFNIKFIPKYRSGGKNGCFGVQTSNKFLTKFFLNYDFRPGRKTHTVRIPDYIMDSEINIQRAFVRGLFDTDGCLRFDHLNEKKHCYPKIEFGFASKGLRDDLYALLVMLGFRAYLWTDNRKWICYKICLTGNMDLKKFIEDISPKNAKHLNKYRLFLEQGYVIPMPRSHNLVLRSHKLS